MDLQLSCPSTVEEEVEALYLARHGPLLHQTNPYFQESPDRCCLQHSTCRHQSFPRENPNTIEMKKYDYFDHNHFASTPSSKYSDSKYINEEKTLKAYSKNPHREVATQYQSDDVGCNDKNGCINIIADVHTYSPSADSAKREYSHKPNQQCKDYKSKKSTNGNAEKHRKHSLDLISSVHDPDEILASRFEVSAASVVSENEATHNKLKHFSKTVNRYKPPDNYYKHNGPGTMKHNVSFPGTSKSSSFNPEDFKRVSQRNGKHSYITKYGFEENIYEEVNDTSNTPDSQESCGLQKSIISLNQSMLEEEVRRVENKHFKILGELNLSMEAMLMPDGDSSDSEKDIDKSRIDDFIGPTDELLSPATYNPMTDLDSGFSGSSSGASYGGSLHCKNDSDRPKSSQSFLRPSLSASGSNHNMRQVFYDTKTVKILGVNHNPDKFEACSSRGSGNFSSPRSFTSDAVNSSSGFWKKKSWKKIPGFSSSSNIDKVGISGLLSRSSSRSKSSPRSPTSNAASQTNDVCETCLKQRC